jgi:hypothetical protein
MATKKTGVTRLGPGRKVVALTDAKAAEEEPMKKVTISLPASAHARFKIYAAQHGTTMTALFMKFLEELESDA